MIISHSKQFIFLKSPKTASTSTERLFKQHVMVKILLDGEAHRLCQKAQNIIIT